MVIFTKLGQTFKLETFGYIFIYEELQPFIQPTNDHFSMHLFIYSVFSKRLLSMVIGAMSTQGKDMVPALKYNWKKKKNRQLQCGGNHSDRGGRGS